MDVENCGYAVAWIEIVSDDLVNADSGDSADSAICKTATSSIDIRRTNEVIFQLRSQLNSAQVVSDVRDLGC